PFLYRARPGDHPGIVAEMFGIPSRDIPAFLAANGISDATKVSAGFVYRIPNAAARALAERTAALEGENTRLKRTAGEEQVKAERLAQAAEDARAEKARAESRATQLARLERLWPWAKATLTLLLAAAAGALASPLRYSASRACRTSFAGTPRASRRWLSSLHVPRRDEARDEWDLACAALNLRRLQVLGVAAALARPPAARGGSPRPGTAQ